MALIRTEALVLRAIDFSESTQIASFFSPTLGKFTAMARGVKRMKSRLGPRLEAFAHVEVSVYAREGATMGNLSSIEPLERWGIFQRDLKAYAMAALVVESIDRGSAEGKPAAELFRTALSYLRMLDGGADIDSLTIHALLRVLCLLGFAPDLRELKGTAAARMPLFFNPQEGRFQDAAPADLHLPRLRLEPPMREWLRESMSLRLDDFDKQTASPEHSRALIKFLVELIQYNLETELKSMRFVRKMIWEKNALA